MKPNFKSPYFLYSLVCIGLYVVALLVARHYTMQRALGEIDTNITYLALSAEFVLIGCAGLFWRMSSNTGLSIQEKAITLVAAPLLLSPILAVLHVLIVLAPIYDLVGQSL